MPKAKDRIFVSIAAYRDAELVPTVRDLIAKAARPGALTVAILNQDAKKLRRSDFPAHRRLLLDNCHHSEARGVGWARARVQQRYDGEGFYFQIDAHHRFTPGWDESLRAQLAACPATSPLLSVYLPQYWHEDGAVKFADPFAGPMLCRGFNHDGMPLVITRPHWTDLPPFPGSHISGHYIFSHGDLVTRVPYDPDFYFTGEEPSLAARAYTHGFDIFNPVRCFAWHHYGRKEGRRHWDDHNGENTGIQTHWTAEMGRSIDKWNRLFGIDRLVTGPDGLGTTRTLADYEAWSGINYHWRIAHPRALGDDPPPIATSPRWPIEEKLLTECVVNVPLPPLRSVDSRRAETVFIALRDANPRDALVRRVTPAEYAVLRRTGLRATVCFQKPPLSLIVWPLLASGWGKKHEEILTTMSGK